MMKKTEWNRKWLKLMEEIIVKNPQVPVARHISQALADYGDFWGLTDKELHYAFEKYESELELDTLHLAPKEYVDKIIEDTEKLFSEIPDDEEEDEDF